MDEELSFFERNVNLIELATALGYRVDPRFESTRANSIRMEHPVTADKIVIRRDNHGRWSYFALRRERDNGTVVDFLRWRRRFSLGRARQELRAWLVIEGSAPAGRPLRTTIAADLETCATGPRE